MNRKTHAGSCLLVWALMGSLGPACQNYGFEEVLPMIVKEGHDTETVPVSADVDILFIIDNSASMVGEQVAIAESFSRFTGVLDEKFGQGRYRIAVITTGVESDGCRPCPDDRPEIFSCVNDSGESGRFQDLLGHNQGTLLNPDFVFVEDQECRIMDSDNIDRCFYDAGLDRGVVFVGTRGCGYEKGLAPMRSALSEGLLAAGNGGFLRQEAVLAVVVVSDEEDCGEVGEVTENASRFGGRFCYYASKGVGPDGATSDPEGGLPYRLTPVSTYYDFLMGLKGNRAGMVKFAAIVGVVDAAQPSATEIEYLSSDDNAEIAYACETPDCLQNCPAGDTGCEKSCHAYPGTRYVALAELFNLDEGGNGYVDTICRKDFDETMEKLATFVACPRRFALREELQDRALANVLVNGKPVPSYTCTDQAPDHVLECGGPEDPICGAGTCARTWTWEPPDLIAKPKVKGGWIVFAEHYDPCKLVTEDEIRFEVIYVTE